ncbi:hypothetical protein JWG39_15275 [Desulforhopalus vacuolatus]|uniref:hypothetical protein n=1 Tax=Desulforhopalus vacuolatus TaxID=40414 RepID=UPI001965F75B|nr:hypothetical protein [Desulforhopalus vacuolatus]MBM9521181.1 hypothetical protein [Desulforhopalus vacuolatus]
MPKLVVSTEPFPVSCLPSPFSCLPSTGSLQLLCTVYLHRYKESTLARVRNACVTPLFGNFHARLEYLQNEWNAADSVSAWKKFQKEIDDGVKVNYGKFGTLLAEKKKVTGKG